jgi:hypothetical protein
MLLQKPNFIRVVNAFFLSEARSEAFSFKLYCFPSKESLWAANIPQNFL